MEIKHLVSKYVYRIESKPEGGFVARATDPNAPTLEAATREELQQKIQSTVLAGLGADFPGLKLSSPSAEPRFSFHVEKRPDGGFDVHSSDQPSGPLNAASHDEVESHFAEKMLAFVGKHMLEGAPEALRAQLTSGDIKVFIKKNSGFTVSPDALSAMLDGGSSSPQATAVDGNSVGITSNSPVTLGSSATPVDSSPITPVSEGGGKFLRILLALAILAGVIFLFLRHR